MGTPSQHVSRQGNAGHPGVTSSSAAPGAPLPELNGAQRQRRMIDAGATPAEVYAECVEETQGTYQEETVT